MTVESKGEESELRVGRPSDAVAAPRATARRDKKLCGARKRQSEGTCRRPAGWGTDHVGIGACKLHGGSTPNGRRSAQAKATDTEARAMLERLGAPDALGDPVEELLMIGAEARAYLSVLRERLSELQEFSKDDVALIDRERAIVKLYGDGLDRTHRVLVDLAKLGLDERMTRVREAQALGVIEAVAKMLADPQLALDADHQRIGLRLLATTLVSAGVSKALAIDASVVSDQDRTVARLMPHQTSESGQ